MRHLGLVRAAVPVLLAALVGVLPGVTVHAVRGMRALRPVGFAPPAPPRGGPLPLLHAVPVPGGVGRIDDALGRQVLLRGVNVDSLGQYDRNARFPATLPFGPADASVVRDLGFDAVRLVVSWSRIEPAPGRYDDGYLDEVARTVRQLADRRVYTVVDMHQDAWSAAVAARPGERCGPLTRPNLGWDGAPAWATPRGLPHCHRRSRESSPVVLDAWQAFLTNAPGPGDVGLQTRFAAMWQHVARRLARLDGLAGFDVLNEPLALTAVDAQRLAHLYTRVLGAIRAGERAGGGPMHVVFVEPSITFTKHGAAAPVPFPHDGDVAYAPHVYAGTFPPTSTPSATRFAAAARYARALGGLPVVSGEWGGRPRSRDPIDAAFFDAYQDQLDRFRFGGMYWLYESSCGDPHELAAHALHAAGLYDVDCRTNRVLGMRPVLADVLARPYPRAVAGTLERFAYSPLTHRLELAFRPAALTTAPSEVALPRRAFPHGYLGLVRGGRVLSRRGADVLLVRSCPRVRQVSLWVRPGPGRVRSDGC